MEWGKGVWQGLGRGHTASDTATERLVSLDDLESFMLEIQPP